MNTKRECKINGGEFHNPPKISKPWKSNTKAVTLQMRKSGKGSTLLKRQTLVDIGKAD